MLPVFNNLYKSVKSGKETARVISACSGKDYQKRLAKELGAMRNSEMWQAGAASALFVRRKKPKPSPKAPKAWPAGRRNAQ